jgi:hypothetical protein
MMNVTMNSRMKIKSLRWSVVICGLVVLVTASLTAAAASDESDVRNAIQHTFDQLKSGEYAALYDSLPASTRSRLPRDRFVNGLQRSQGIFQLQRIEIGPVRVSGDLAVADTVMYAHIAKPFDADGKLVVQQYVIREGGSWHVVTGDNATINRFLKNNPKFARRFPIKRPNAYVNQNGKWVAVPLGARRG